MIVNVILPVTSKPEEFVQFIQRESAPGVRFFVGVRSKFQSAFVGKGLKNTEIHVFSDHSGREEIINSLHTAKMRRGKILVARRVLNPFEFASLKNSETDITSLQSEQRGILKWLKRMASSIVKRMFAFAFFEDISAICFGEDMFELVSALKNLSSASRVNRYVGTTFSEVETREKPVVKEFHRLKTWSIFAANNIFFFGSIAGAVLIFVFCSVSSIVALLLILWVLLAFMIYAMGMISFSRSLVVGDLNIGTGEEFTTIKNSTKKPKKEAQSNENEGEADEKSADSEESNLKN